MRDIIVIRKMCIKTYANTLLHHDYMAHKIITWDDCTVQRAGHHIIT